MHDFVSAPFVAVTVTTSPAEPPDADIVGVASFVTSSELDEPASEDEAKSGTDGALGTNASTDNDIDEPLAETFPAGSVSVPETVQLPPDNVGKSQDDPVPTVYEHDTVDTPLVALIVATSPTEPPDTENAGVVSEVRLSVEDEPKSDDANKSGTEGAEGADVSTVKLKADPTDETFPAKSVRVEDTDHTPAVSVGKSHEVAEPTV